MNQVCPWNKSFHTKFQTEPVPEEFCLNASSDDGHNGSADVGSTFEYFSSNGFHHPWRSTAWEIHPVIKIEVIE
jgi:hypothetical protein